MGIKLFYLCVGKKSDQVWETIAVTHGALLCVLSMKLPQIFTYINSHLAAPSPGSLLLSPFNRWRSRGIERLSNFPTIPTFAKVGFEPRKSASRNCILSHLVYTIVLCRVFILDIWSGILSCSSPCLILYWEENRKVKSLLVNWYFFWV